MASKVHLKRGVLGHVGRNQLLAVVADASRTVWAGWSDFVPIRVGGYMNVRACQKVILGKCRRKSTSAGVCSSTRLAADSRSRSFRHRPGYEEGVAVQRQPCGNALI